MAGPNANLANGQELVALPLSTAFAWYTFRVGLSGVQYTFTVRYDSRMDRWILDLADAQGSPVIIGVPLLIGLNLLGRFTGQTNVPIGKFYATDNTSQSTQPTRYSFGITHTLWYLDPLAIT